MTAVDTHPDAHPLDDLPWWEWLAGVLPDYCSARMAEHHGAFWEWVWDLTPGVRPDPLVVVLPRGGGKSSSTEMAVVAVGARRQRRYCLWVSGTQDQADKHVNSIAGMLESERVGILYPDLAEKKVSKHGNSKGWRHDRLYTAAGFVVDAAGLDTGTRGIKIEEQRPDLIVFDDVDERHDSAAQAMKKIETITESIIPAGSPDVATVGVQNLIHKDSVFAQLADGRAKFLRKRTVIGPIPALKNFREDETGEIHGDPTWEGQDLATCRDQWNDWGPVSFRREAQHALTEAEGSLWGLEQLEALRVPESEREKVIARGFKAAVVTVDPSGGDGPENDEVGILVCARGYDDHGYVLADLSGRMVSNLWGRTAVMGALDHGFRRIRGERNFGGKIVSDVIHTAMNELHREGIDGALSLDVDTIWSSDGKRVRAEPVAALFGEKDKPASWSRGIFHIVGTCPELEGELTGWEPDKSKWSPNRLDVLAFAGHDLFPDLMGGLARTGVRAATRRHGSIG